jgi:hypothetical protein
MQLCGCLPVGNSGVQDDEKKSNIKQSGKKYSLKRGRWNRCGCLSGI